MYVPSLSISICPLFSLICKFSDLRKIFASYIFRYLFLIYFISFILCLPLQFFLSLILSSISGCLKLCSINLTVFLAIIFKIFRLAHIFSNTISFLTFFLLLILGILLLAPYFESFIPIVHVSHLYNNAILRIYV